MGQKSRSCSFCGDVALRGYRFAHGGSPGAVKTGVSARVTGTAHGHRYSARRPPLFIIALSPRRRTPFTAYVPSTPPLLAESFREIMRHLVFVFPRHRDKAKRFIVMFFNKAGDRLLIGDRRTCYWLVKFATMFLVR